MMRDRTTSVKPSTLHEGLDNVLFDVWLVSRATTAMLDERLAPSGIDSDEFAIYSMLRSKDGMTPIGARALDGGTADHGVELL